MRSRSRSIRSKLVLLLLVPLLSLTALWGFGASITLGPGLSLVNVGTLVDFAKTADSLSSALQAERRAAAVQAAKPGADSLRAFVAARKKTDTAASGYFSKADGDDVRSAIKPQAVSDIDAYRAAIDNLATIRRQLTAGHGTVPGVMEVYTTALTASYTVTDSTIITFGDADFAKDSRDVLDLARARDTLSQEDAVMAAMLARGGAMSPAEHARFAEAMGVQRYQYAQVVPKLSPSLQKRYAAIVASPEFQRMRTMENRVANQTRHGQHMPFMADQWESATSKVLKDQQAVLLAGADDLTAEGKPIAVRILGQLAATALFGLIAVIVSLVISVRMSRTLIRELRELRHSAREVAEKRLPTVVRRLRLGEQIDVDAEVLQSEYRTTEIAQVGAAFGSVQRTAMVEAVGESRLRTGIRDVFVNLARRSQALLHRQLKLLDGMERRTEDPDELERLFQLDHLATRMRRHAEGLIILSGNTPGRNWRRPVPMIDVMRAAVAEVEDYPRVTVLPMPDAALSGPAVADVVHLVAELVENATLYSPPHTEVRISAEHVGNGYVVEIDDRGLSMSPEDLAAANQRLSAPPEFDLSDSARLGLFVVARLARRHGIRVSLRVSPYGGTSAVVLLPADLVITDETTPVDTGPFGERVRPAGVGAGAAVEEEPEDASGLGPTGRLQAAPDAEGVAAEEEPGEPPVVAPVPDPAAGSAPPPYGPFGPYGPPEGDDGAPVRPTPVPRSETGDDVPAHLLRGGPEPAAEPEPGPGTEDPDLARRGPAGPYPKAPEAELPRTAGGLPRRVRTTRRDAESTGTPAGPATPAGAAPFAPGPHPDVGTPGPATPAGATPFAPGPDATAGRDVPPAGPAPGDAQGAPAMSGTPGDVAPRDPFVPLTQPDGVPGEPHEPGPGPVQSDPSRPPLPKRVRQASLAPQLRTDTRASDLELDLSDADPSDGRTPEQARSMMASIQQGWLRGRAADPGPEPGPEQAQAGQPAEEEDI